MVCVELSPMWNCWLASKWKIKALGSFSSCLCWLKWAYSETALLSLLFNSGTIELNMETRSGDSMWCLDNAAKMFNFNIVVKKTWQFYKKQSVIILKVSFDWSIWSNNGRVSLRMISQVMMSPMTSQKRLPSHPLTSQAALYRDDVTSFILLEARIIQEGPSWQVWTNLHLQEGWDLRGSRSEDDVTTHL